MDRPVLFVCLFVCLRFGVASFAGLVQSTCWRGISSFRFVSTTFIVSI